MDKFILEVYDCVGVGFSQKDQKDLENYLDKNISKTITELLPKKEENIQTQQQTQNASISTQRIRENNIQVFGILLDTFMLHGDYRQKIAC